MVQVTEIGQHGELLIAEVVQGLWRCCRALQEFLQGQSVLQEKGLME
jgi:hypothetical protein